MIGLFVWGAMYLARTIEYAVQDGRSFVVSFVRLLPLAGLGATESGIDCGVIGVIAIASAFVSVAPKLASAILGLRGACLAGCVVTTSQPTVLSRAKVGHECREGRHGLWLFLAKVAREPFVPDAVFEGCQGLGIRTVNDLVLFG